MSTPNVIRLLVAAAGAAKPRPPQAGRIVWGWFVELSDARQYGQHGPQALTFSEMDAWARLRGVPLRPDHVAILRRMDDAWLKAAFARMATRAQTGQSGGPKILPPASSHPISPALFDVIA